MRTRQSIRYPIRAMTTLSVMSDVVTIPQTPRRKKFGTGIIIITGLRGRAQSSKLTHHGVQVNVHAFSYDFEVQFQNNRAGLDLTKGDAIKVRFVLNNLGDCSAYYSGSHGQLMSQIPEVAARHLLRREQAVSPLPRETMDIVGPDVLTGGAIAGIWSETLGRPNHYAGDDLAAFEQQFRAFVPVWMAYDMRLMVDRFQRDGMVAASGDVDRLTALLGRPLRSYRDFAAETAKQWQGAKVVNSAKNFLATEP
jgi:hypothetical protein